MKPFEECNKVLIVNSPMFNIEKDSYTKTMMCGDTEFYFDDLE
jgi:hypothetical protein